MDILKIKAALSKAVDVVEFTPSESHRRAKSNFWSYFSSNDSLPPTSVTLDLASKYCGDRRITEWWSSVGFEAWFSNRDEFKQRVEFLADLALDQLYSLLKDPETGAASKVAAIRMIMDVGQKMAAKAPKEDTIETKIAKMSKAELETFIRAGVSKLLPDEDTLGRESDLRLPS